MTWCAVRFLMWFNLVVCSFFSGDGPEEWKLKGMFVDLG